MTRKSPTSVLLQLLLGALCSTGTRASADVCDRRGVLEPPVARILSTVAKRLDVPVPERWTLATAHGLAADHLARPAGCERLSEASRRQYRRLFASLDARDVAQLQHDLAEAGFCRGVAPKGVHFDYVLLNGSTAPSVRKRIHELAQAVASGAVVLSPATQVVFLDGERALFASETPAVLLNASPFAQEPAWKPPEHLPVDERAMDEMLWQQMQLPEALRRQGILFVHAQKQPGAARAQTADCVAAWVRARHPKPGKALVVSNNPFVEYQRRVTEVLLAQSGASSIEVTAMGPAAELEGTDAAIRLGLLLDALAGTVFRASQQEDLGLLTDGAKG